MWWGRLFKVPRKKPWDWVFSGEETVCYVKFGQMRPDFRCETLRLRQAMVVELEKGDVKLKTDLEGRIVTDCKSMSQARDQNPSTP